MAAPSSLPAVVFDCNIYLQAAVRETGPAFACLQLAEAGRVTLVTSREVIAEVADVLTRPIIRRKFPTLTPAYVSRYLARVATFAVLFDPIPPTAALTRDSKDQPYLDLAAAVQAAYLVTRDKDLLDLGGEGSELPFAIIDPASLLQLLRS
jgi:putative PIN family toxin of toxin-antitoxin system